MPVKFSTKSPVDLRDRKIVAVLAWSQAGVSRRSDGARAEATTRFEGYLRSRPDAVLEDLYRSLPISYRSHHG